MKDLSPILLYTTPWDEPYLGAFRSFLRGRRAFQISANPDNAHEVALYAKSQGIKYIISTNPVVLNRVVDSGRSESLDNWAGSLWEHSDITYLFLSPLKQLFSVPYGRWIAERFTSKITNPGSWPKTPEFSWEPARVDTIHHWFELFSRSILIASDIETASWDEFPENPLQSTRETLIRSVSYTGLWADGNIHTLVIPIGDAPPEHLSFFITYMRKFNLLPQPKIYQRGLYDTFHKIRYHAPVRNYLFDTQSIFHSWQAELPKDLAFIAAATIHNIFYWKDMAKSSNQWKQWEYNGRDSWATLVSFLGLVRECPEYVWKNHLIKFPLWVPCLDCNLEGFKCDNEARAVALAKDIAELQECERKLQHWFGNGFNPRSPKQVIALIAFYGSPDIATSGEVELLKFGTRHPLNNLFANTILKSREISKRISSYYKPADFSVAKSKAKKKQSPLLYKGRIYYALDPDGTDTSRLSCKEGTNWTGMQIQNQPRNPEGPKAMEIADPGWRIFELDNEKSESYTTAYKSGSLSFIETLRQDREEGIDFHRMNGTKFFGLKYDEVPQELRDDACKRIIYGAQNNMGPDQLQRLMGDTAVDKAKHLLNLPVYYTRKQVCQMLIDAYDVAYPDVRKNPDSLYTWIRAHVASTKLLVSDLGWTRYCHGHPDKNRQDLNAYAAHIPQVLSVGILNEGFKEGYWKIRLPNARNIRLKAQIHDSILGQVRVGHEHLIMDFRQILQRKINVTDKNGITRIMEIPVAAKISPVGGSWASCIKWKGEIDKLP
jgi:hypothetical protein